MQRPIRNEGENLCEYLGERILQKQVPLKYKFTEVAQEDHESLGKDFRLNYIKCNKRTLKDVEQGCDTI